MYTSVEFTSHELDMQDAEVLPDREALGIFDFGNGVNLNLENLANFKLGIVNNVNTGDVGGNLTQVGVVS